MKAEQMLSTTRQTESGVAMSSQVVPNSCQVSPICHHAGGRRGTQATMSMHKVYIHTLPSYHLYHCCIEAPSSDSLMLL